MRFTDEEVFQALGDPHRLKMLALLSRGPRPVGAVARHFRLTQPAVSHHLAVLRRAGCVVAEKKGKEVFYRLNACCFEECFTGLARRLGLGSPKNSRKTRSFVCQ
jgi:DNA-binding transcriptional ArsR family regulator